MQALPEFDSSSPDYRRQDGARSAVSVDTSGETIRREIARELHDAVIQPLATLVVDLRVGHHSLAAVTVANDLSAWQTLAQEALDALRAALADLRMAPHGNLDLPEAVRQHLIPQFQRVGLKLHVKSTNWPLNLPSEWTSSLYLVLREAVTNAHKHGHASQVSIFLRADTQHLLVTIVDDGTGFAPDKVSTAQSARPGTGLGLQAMHERVWLLGGYLRVTAAPGDGTRVEMSIPVPDNMSLSGTGVGEPGCPAGPSSYPVH